MTMTSYDRMRCNSNRIPMRQELVPHAIGSDSHCGEVDCVTEIGRVFAKIESVEMRGYRWAEVRSDNKGFLDYVADQFNEAAGLTRNSSLAADRDFYQTIPSLVTEYIATQTPSEAS